PAPEAPLVPSPPRWPSDRPSDPTPCGILPPQYARSGTRTPSLADRGARLQPEERPRVLGEDPPVDLEREASVPQPAALLLVGVREVRKVAPEEDAVGVPDEILVAHDGRVDPREGGGGGRHRHRGVEMEVGIAVKEPEGRPRVERAH